jgi:hypothetical protein
VGSRIRGNYATRKIRPQIETFDPQIFDTYAQACGWVLAGDDRRAAEEE